MFYTEQLNPHIAAMILQSQAASPHAEVLDVIYQRYTGEASLEQLLKRPELNYRDIARISPSPMPVKGDASEQVEIQVKYDGYIMRQLDQVERFAGLEQKAVPADLDYDTVTGLGAEVRQKLKQVRPVSLGQASRISGVTPAAISLLLVALEKRKRGGMPA